MKPGSASPAAGNGNGNGRGGASTPTPGAGAGTGAGAAATGGATGTGTGTGGAGARAGSAQASPVASTSAPLGSVSKSPLEMPASGKYVQDQEYWMDSARARRVFGLPSNPSHSLPSETPQNKSAPQPPPTVAANKNLRASYAPFGAPQKHDSPRGEFRQSPFLGELCSCEKRLTRLPRRAKAFRLQPAVHAFDPFGRRAGSPWVSIVFQRSKQPDWR